jgi:hypothetical protein
MDANTAKAQILAVAFWLIGTILIVVPLVFVAKLLIEVLK